ncbi:MAG: hypothetical protein QGD94_08490 [Planctomycetia bacterium]|nr:hypothetical protein [Planctomycetia bacterium]
MRRGDFAAAFAVGVAAVLCAMPALGQGTWEAKATDDFLGGVWEDVIVMTPAGVCLDIEQVEPVQVADLPGSYLFDLKVYKGRLYASAGGKVHEYDGKKFKTIEGPSSGAEMAVWRGKLWAGNGSWVFDGKRWKEKPGLKVLDPGEKNPIAPNHIYVFQDKLHAISGNKLFYYDGKKEAWQAYPFDLNKSRYRTPIGPWFEQIHDYQGGLILGAGPRAQVFKVTGGGKGVQQIFVFDPRSDEMVRDFAKYGKRLFFNTQGFWGSTYAYDGKVSRLISSYDHWYGYIAKTCEALFVSNGILFVGTGTLMPKPSYLYRFDGKGMREVAKVQDGHVWAGIEYKGSPYVGTFPQALCLRIPIVYKNRGTYMSPRINPAGTKVKKVTLAWTEKLNGGSITYGVSRDGGIKWYNVKGKPDTNKTTVVFKNTGEDLRVRAILETRDKSKTPVMLSLKVRYE